jgi:hypothetical protein
VAIPAAACGENGTPGPGVTNGNGKGFGGPPDGRISPRLEGGNVPNSSNEDKADGFDVVVVFGEGAGRAGVPGSTLVDTSICEGLDERSSESVSEALAELVEQFGSGAGADVDMEDEGGGGGGGIGSRGCKEKPGGRNCGGVGNAGLKLGGIKLAANSGFIIDDMDIGFAASPLSNDNGSDIFA